MSLRQSGSGTGIAGNRRFSQSVRNWRPGNGPDFHQTGLSGLFDYHFDYIIPPPDEFANEDATDRFANVTAALRKLGLELKSTTGDADFFVIDHMERPTEN